MMEDKEGELRGLFKRESRRTKLLCSRILEMSTCNVAKRGFSRTKLFHKFSSSCSQNVTAESHMNSMCKCTKDPQNTTMAKKQIRREIEREEIKTKQQLDKFAGYKSKYIVNRTEDIWNTYCLAFSLSL